MHNCEDDVGRVPPDGKEGRCGWLVSTARIFTNAANATNDDDDDDDDEAASLKHTFIFHFYPYNLSSNANGKGIMLVTIW